MYPEPSLYEVQSNRQPSYSQMTTSHRGHPWPGLVETAGTTDDAMAWAKKNAYYLGGGALIVAGLAAWKMGWFK
jgi:hypothetical protein